MQCVCLGLHAQNAQGESGMASEQLITHKIPRKPWHVH